MRSMQPQKTRGRQRGAALIFALTLLALFAVLGTSYVVGMSLRNDATNLVLRSTRAEHLAEAGLHAAIGELGKAISEGRVPEVLAAGQMEFQFPAYEGVMTEKGYLLDQAPRTSFAAVQVLDESGKLNLNHAPASMLRLLLNVDGATARNITASLPGRRLFDTQPDAERHWFSGIDELVSRGFLSQQQLDMVDQSLFTTSSVADNSKPERFLNVNAVSAPVLAALMDVPVELAQEAMQKRPFQSMADLENAAHKKGFTFNIKPDPGHRDELPPELALESRCFRLVSLGTYGLEGQSVARRASARAEAVVVFDSEGKYTITSWSAGAGVDERAPVSTPQPAEPAMAEATPQPETAPQPEAAGGGTQANDETAPAGDAAAQP